MEAVQLYDLIDYINETRKLLLAVTNKNADTLFISIGSSDRVDNAITKMLENLKKQ